MIKKDISPITKAEFLQAVANGEQMQRKTRKYYHSWVDCTPEAAAFRYAQDMPVRIKPLPDKTPNQHQIKVAEVKACKAAFIADFGDETEWFGTPGSWFFEGYKCGNRALEARVAELEQLCAETYQVVGGLLTDLDRLDSVEGQEVLDNLSQQKRIHTNVLPWRYLQPTQKEL